MAWEIPSAGKISHPASESVPAACPGTYPDGVGFEMRKEALLAALATNDLAKWRRGYFAGGDPGKYLPGPAMAKLILDPENAEAREFMNDARSPREHYHFAAINWARFLPLFGGSLTPEARRTLAEAAAKYSAYLAPSGTENHKTMNLFAACVLPEYLDGGRIAHKNREAALGEAKENLRAYVKGLYANGQGEWDSPTYMMFSLHGLLNIYDFSSDPEMRQIAAAGLDWLTAAYALKYRDGLFSGPNQRGYYDVAFQSIADMTGWLWWGGDARPKNLASYYYAIHPATSSWRPNKVLTNIAQKTLPGLPATQLNSKPNYWFGQGIPPIPGNYPETLHLGKSFTMGSIWRGFGSQINRFHLVANDNNGPLALTGGHPRKSDHTGKKLDELTFRDGGGRYDQSAQDGPLYLCLSRIPDDEPEKFTFVSVPEGVSPENTGGRWIFRMGGIWVAVIPFTKTSELVEAGIVAPKAPRLLRFPGNPSGFAVIAADSEQLKSAQAFAAWLDSHYRFDLSKFASGAEVTVHHDERTLRAAYGPEGMGTTAGFPIPTPRDIFSGPFVNLKNSILTVTDGHSGYEVNFSGDLPVYRPLACKGN
ncbi:MAG: hypothetical protein Fur0032_06100 [Terrimicrobiaceae bacterium]